ncbi:MAG TPA: energy transducer TonB [Puia sp.]|jgi:protein TonB
MKRVSLLCILLSGFFVLNAQTTAQLDSIARGLKSDSTIKVEIESDFPGGLKGWNSFLSNTLVYPKKAIKKNIQGQVVARFIVEKDGSLSDIEIISGPKELWPAVLDVLKQSPNWKPAIQNGKKVKSYKVQPFNFRLES